MSLPVLECNDFSFNIGKTPILDNISFKIMAGERLSIVGPNGSGKSTLLKCCMRLMPNGKIKGDLAIYNRPLATYSQKQLAQKVSYMPQAKGADPSFTVEAFVNLSRYPYLNTENTSLEVMNESVCNALKLTNTAELAHKRLDQLSGGQRQRVYLAAALAQATNLLLLDEPTVFLDPSHVFAINGLLNKLHRENGLTIVTVTHDLSQLFDAGGKALILQQGKQIFFGPVSELIVNGILEKAFNHKFNYLEHPVTHRPIVVL